MVRGFGQRVLSPQQAREVKILRRSVLQHFQHFPDPRVERTQHHSLAAIVILQSYLDAPDRIIPLPVVAANRPASDINHSG